jgi:aminoglycoside phosphotransferase (APT) family kinase protein
MMMDAMIRKPWTVRHHSQLLADLHDRLHEITAPDWMTRLDGEGDRFLHLDLHPMNVMLTSRGPVVIDWTNAAAGDALTDVGLTYVLMTCAAGPMPRLLSVLLDPFRRWMTNAFVRPYQGPDLDEHIARAAELKMFDPNMSPGEVEACRRLAAGRRGR